MASVAKAAGVPLDRVRRRAAELQEANPMLGHRGCRLAITYPEICERLGVLSMVLNRILRAKYTISIYFPELLEIH